MDKPIIRVPANLPGPAFTADGFINFASRVGTSSDKASHGTYMLRQFGRMEIEAAYRTSWFRKIVDIIPFDEVREWRTWSGADEGQVTKIDTEEKRLNLRGKLKFARTLARKDGGAAIVIDDGTKNAAITPLDPEQMQVGGIKSITVLSRYRIHPGAEIRDPSSAWFGEPEYYSLTDSAGTRIHPSRVLRFVGNPILFDGYWDGWGDSVWIELCDAIRRADQVSAGTAAMIDEAKLDIIKLKNLAANLVTQEGEEALLKRWAAVNLLKSVANALVIDAEDEFDTKTLNFQGLKDVDEIMLMVMSGMADIPQTRLFGRSPEGMNATGDSDLKNYYDRIRAGQNVNLTPLLHPLDEMIIRSALGSRPDELYYEWSPLYSLSEKEQADVEQVFATAATSYANSGLIPTTALTKIVENGITERGAFPGSEKAFAEAAASGDIPDINAEPSPLDVAQEQAQIAEATFRAKNPDQAVNGNKRLVATKDAAPRTLYVRRNVLNADAIIKWAKSQGFKTTMPASEMHVTIAYSRTPLDWMKIPGSWSFGNADGEMDVQAGGARLVERLGQKAVVLLFNSSELTWRNQAIREFGASWEWSEYQPHITISYEGAPDDLDAVVPYRGPIKLGPEIWDEVHEDWAKGVTEE